MAEIYVPPKKEGDPDQGSTLFGVSLPGTALPLIVGSMGILVFYCLSSLAQEFVYKSGWSQTTFLTFYCKAMAALWGGLGGGWTHRKAPQFDHALVGALTLATMWLSNESLVYLDYPGQTVFKSAKLIPVMIAGRFILKKHFSFTQYLAAMSLFLGLVIFTLTDVKTSPNFHFLGVLYISAALVADALLGNYQEKMFKDYQPSTHEMLTWSNLYAALGSLLLCLSSGELTSSVKSITEHPEILKAISLYSFCNIIGIYFVLVMIYRFGAATTTFVTCLRKAVTVVLSFLVFTKPFSVGYVIGGCLVLFGIYLNVRAANKTKATTIPSSSSSSSLIIEDKRNQVKSNTEIHPALTSISSNIDLATIPINKNYTPPTSTINTIPANDQVSVTDADMSRWMDMELEENGGDPELVHINQSSHRV